MTHHAVERRLRVTDASPTCVFFIGEFGEIPSRHMQWRAFSTIGKSGAANSPSGLDHRVTSVGYRSHEVSSDALSG